MISEMHMFKLILGFFFLIFYTIYLNYKIWNLRKDLERLKLFTNVYCKKINDIVLDKNYLPFEGIKSNKK